MMGVSWRGGLMRGRRRGWVCLDLDGDGALLFGCSGASGLYFEEGVETTDSLGSEDRG